MYHYLSLSSSNDFLLNDIPITEEEAIRIWNNDDADVYWTNDALVEMNGRIHGFMYGEA